jgi:hypothetical protein
LISVAQRVEDKAEARAKKEKAERAASLAALEKQVPEMSSRELCTRYAGGRFPVIRAELIRRAAPTPAEWQLVDQREISIGMSELALICSWGDTARNRTVFATSVHTQYVYLSGRYVYVENGKVVSWQD